jgi:hypothetical protein
MEEQCRHTPNTDLIFKDLSTRHPGAGADPARHLAGFFCPGNGYNIHLPLGHK